MIRPERNGNPMEKNRKKDNKQEKSPNNGDEDDRRIEQCGYAPEWAEHARLYEDNDPCDDGRAGLTVCGKREGETPCPL
jgi:hypothetical protein